jgi:hypothetical protein
MVHFIRGSMMCIVTLGVYAIGSSANIPDPDLSSVPAYLTMTPASNSQGIQAKGIQAAAFVPFLFTMVVEGPGGPIANALVELEFSPDGDDLITWCDGETHPLKSGVTDANGEVTFTFYGGGAFFPRSSGVRRTSGRLAPPVSYSVRGPSTPRMQWIPGDGP